MTLSKIAARSLRALSRFLCASMGAYGKNTDRGTMPLSRSCTNVVTSAKRVSRISRPSRHRDAVSTMSSESASSKSTSPSSPHLAKKSSASLTIMPTYWRRRLDLSESAKKRNCSARVVWSTSNTTPFPKVGTLNSYTSFWDISVSFALKKCSLTFGPIRNVMRLWNTGTVNTSPYFGNASAISPIGPRRNAAMPPTSGIAPMTGGDLNGLSTTCERPSSTNSAASTAANARGTSASGGTPTAEASASTLSIIGALEVRGRRRAVQG
mmetsp:Transcript_7709/g.32769  ORF Transcript_7709/g.32769 Transcript_7709/m.32769 type:complete len:267 (+) Transcript_7709:862-1662(+)